MYNPRVFLSGLYNVYSNNPIFEEYPHDIPVKLLEIPAVLHHRSPSHQHESAQKKNISSPVQPSWYPTGQVRLGGMHQSPGSVLMDAWCRRMDGQTDR